VQERGFEGHYMSTYRIVKQQLQTGNISPITGTKPIPIPRLSVTEAAWLLIHPDDRLDDMQLRLRTKLIKTSHEISTARELAQSFFIMVRNRMHSAFVGWLEQAKASQIKAFMNFAASLKRDFASVHAALTLPWSSGQVEGQVNRLKLTKRKLYGRANFDLLRKHVLGMPMAAYARFAGEPKCGQGVGEEIEIAESIGVAEQAQKRITGQLGANGQVEWPQTQRAHIG
jgi:hypothetical protein